MPRGDQGSKPRRQWAPDARALSVVGDRWVMVIVRDLASGPLRLEALRRWLPGVSAGALESRLSRMAEAGLITRRRRRSLPPRVDLELTERGHALMEAIGELARWELRTHWSRPREDEWVDVGACFRLAPLLPRAAATADGRLVLTIADASGGPEHYTFVRDHGRARIEHNDSPEPDTRMSGAQAAWVKALSPEGAPSTLKVTGNGDLAAEFLDLFKAHLD
ncbi:MAG TPA: winged helix-turn-helix transcriptional regulator [Conexibacter sp.]|jgi:DNA-binding HxlR family transcriptional regulator|nr:winged helix-turn-helix transcriptional regulator [Conexibacter sp.]